MPANYSHAETLAEPGELGVTVPDEELDRARPLGELHGEVAGLLGHPVHDLLGGHAGDPHQARVMVDEDEHVARPEQHRLDGEEVTSDDALGLSTQQPCPGRSPRRGDGLMPWRSRIAETLDAATRKLIVASSRWILR